MMPWGGLIGCRRRSRPVSTHCQTQTTFLRSRRHVFLLARQVFASPTESLFAPRRAVRPPGATFACLVANRRS